MVSDQEAVNLLKRAAKPIGGEGIKDAINRMARHLHWSFARTRAIWYGEARRIDAHEMDQLRRLANEQAARFHRVADAMQAVDPDFYVDEITTLVSAARKLSGED